MLDTLVSDLANSAKLFDYNISFLCGTTYNSSTP